MYFRNDGIQPMEAVNLLKGGDWVQQNDVISAAVQKCIQFMNERPPVTRDKQQFEKYESLLISLRRDPWPFESRVVVEADSRLDPRVAVRVGMGTILKIGESVKNSVVPALGLILYSASTADAGGLLYVGFVVMGWPVVDTLRKAFETIDDPDELAVFEMVATISGELRLVNAEALDKENFAEAYGKCAPYKEDIVARLDKKSVSAHTVEKCLVALRKRNVLDCIDDRWHIAF